MSLIDDAAEYNVLGTERDLARLRAMWLKEDREREILRSELDRARMTNEHLVKVLSGIYGLLYPPLVKLSDGRAFAFKPQNLDPHEYMQALSDRIRAIPDEIAALPLDKEAT